MPLLSPAAQALGRGVQTLPLPAAPPPLRPGRPHLSPRGGRGARPSIFPQPLPHVACWPATCRPPQPPGSTGEGALSGGGEGAEASLPPPSTQAPRRLEALILLLFLSGPLRPRSKGSLTHPVVSRGGGARWGAGHLSCSLSLGLSPRSPTLPLAPLPEGQHPPGVPSGPSGLSGGCRGVQHLPPDTPTRNLFSLSPSPRTAPRKSPTHFNTRPQGRTGQSRGRRGGAGRGAGRRPTRRPTRRPN